MIIEKRYWIEGMDSDTNARMMSDKAMLNLMNGGMAVSENGRDFRIENRPGTTAISQDVFPVATQQCLGSCVDEARHRILFAEWSSNGEHGIYALDYSTPSTPVIYAVIYDSQVTGGLGFSKSYRINRNMKVVGDLLYWTDNTNAPRRINIEAGIKLNHPSYSTSVTPYTSPLAQSVIKLIRRPPGIKPSASAQGTNSNSFIKDFSGQFAMRYIYRDGEYSVFGVPSDFIGYNIASQDYIEVGWLTGGGETIIQDVQVIQIAVRYGNDPSYFIIKEWDKDNTTDAATIATFNAGSGPLLYNFYNDEIGVAVSDADSVKPFDSIPLTVKTLEVANNRLFLGNYVKGYNVPTTTSLTGVAALGGAITGIIPEFKSFSSYQIGIVFRDYEKRKCTTVTNDSLVVTIPDRVYGTVTFYNAINWTLSNAAATTEIPDWAYYYDIVITKNLRTRFFVQAKSFNIKYAYKQADGTFLYNDVYMASAYGLAIDISNLTGYGMGYTFQQGDMARIYEDGSSTVYHVQVLMQDGVYVVVQLINLGNVMIQPPILFELYTPYKKSDIETFYTTGSFHLVANPGTGSRTYTTLTGSLSGDIYRQPRGTGGEAYNQEAMSASDQHWQNWFAPFGDTNNVSLLGQVTKSTFVSWSNVKIEGTRTNGLSTFDASNERNVPQELEAINKLQLANKIQKDGEGLVMLAICNTETASMYLGAVQVIGQDRDAFLAQSPDVIGTINVLKNSSGTINPESVIQYQGTVWWIDVINGYFSQYSNNGIEKVSEFKMSRFFKNYCKNYLANNANNLDNINTFHHIPTAIDGFYKEVLVGLPGLIYENYATNLPSYSSVPSYASSIINRFDIFDYLAKTMAYKFENNYWGSNFEYGAEWYDMVDNQLIGFKAGAPYIMNSNTSAYNTFFDSQKPLRICFPANINPSALKNLFNISVEGNTMPTYVVAMANYPDIQITDLASTDTDASGEPIWVNQEGVFYATFLRDRLSPNSSLGGTADQKMFTGDLLKDFAIFVMCEFATYSSLAYVNFINIGYEIAKGQKAIINPINK